MQPFLRAFFSNASLPYKDNPINDFKPKKAEISSFDDVISSDMNL
ncbi:hypothetical protein B488_03880 [Liberibacter crescens BT-1]|uniref:Uncharacterized protein n=1 Tax=Liberibacter crescens (strain BT-1) TaxID=1215343 RepID=L0EU48_LIBCB|nr:hypothetical protein B488_03880 [Liberibacter crescens BT-1]